MQKIEAYEHNGKLYRTKEEAIQDEFRAKLLNLFRNCNGPEMLNLISNSQKTQDELYEALTKYREGVK